jgi:hypothetical protein
VLCCRRLKRTLSDASVRTLIFRHFRGAINTMPRQVRNSATSAAAQLRANAQQRVVLKHPSKLRNPNTLNSYRHLLQQHYVDSGTLSELPTEFPELRRLYIKLFASASDFHLETENDVDNSASTQENVLEESTRANNNSDRVGVSVESSHAEAPPEPRASATASTVGVLPESIVQKLYDARFPTVFCFFFFFFFFFFFSFLAVLTWSLLDRMDEMTSLKKMVQGISAQPQVLTADLRISVKERLVRPPLHLHLLSLRVSLTPIRLRQRLSPIRSEILAFFHRSPYPPDDALQEFFETKVYPEFSAELRAPGLRRVVTEYGLSAVRNFNLDFAGICTGFSYFGVVFPLAPPTLHGVAKSRKATPEGSLAQPRVFATCRQVSSRNPRHLFRDACVGACRREFVQVPACVYLASDSSYLRGSYGEDSVLK